MNEILNLNNVSKIYEGKVPTIALNNINFFMEKGSFVGIMGPSGSGKTTLLNIISTIDYPSSGEIFVNNKNPYKLSYKNLSLFRRRELGFVFQDFNLISTLTLGENILLPLILDGYSIKEMEKKLIEISQKLNIEDILHKKTFEVSGGQIQRAAIARAIIHSPSLLLADEPTGNLDSKSTKDVMELFESLNKKDNVTTLMVTHNPITASYCNRVIFIKDGELFNEIHRGESRHKFYQQIIDVLSFLGGDYNNDFLSIRPN
ncbi:ABC transporter ATP-binding protein [Clostridium rectalis]|uniref:ABC transporter ATP-binding protein n=1 Tax=Clostridium rectalis TaxID=2040295 RepID=UPI000F64117D|nr:ABC transporter ATP-binding protein [Clostridium rectalis]